VENISSHTSNGCSALWWSDKSLKSVSHLNYVSLDLLTDCGLDKRTLLVNINLLSYSLKPVGN